MLPKGKFILDFFFPSPKVILKTYGKEMKKAIKTNKKKFSLITKSYFVDEPNQIVEIVQTLIKDNKIIWKDILRIAFIYKREFELLLRLAGFKKWKVYGGFNYQSLKSYKQRIVWIIKNI